jgi:hypothetical protein
MTEETKRDVFDKLLNEYVDDERRIDGIVYEPDQHIAELDREYFINSYDAALPDDLPVIPEAVSEYIEDAKASHYELLDAMTKWTLDQPVFDWIHDNSDTFARAWVLGIWRVEETGEIVKLEAYYG